MTTSKLIAIMTWSGKTATLFARIAAFLLAVMMFLTLFDVIGRAFNHPIVGAVESIELMMGMLIYLGVGYTTFDRGHINVDFIIVHFSPRARDILEVFTTLVGVVFIGFVVWRIYDQTGLRWTQNTFTPIWAIPYWPVALVMSISLTLMWLVLFLQWLEVIIRVITGGERPTPSYETTTASAE